MLHLYQGMSAAKIKSKKSGKKFADEVLVYNLWYYFYYYTS